MSRLLTFTQKSRDLNELNNIHRQLIKLFSQHDNLLLLDVGLKEWHLQNGESVFEFKYYVQKQGRKLTWNDVYKMINSVKAVPYEFEKGRIVNNEVRISL